MTPVAAITLRTATTDDEPFLWEMLYHAIFTPPGGPPLARQILDRPELNRYVKGWMRPGDLGIIAEDEGTAIGAAWVRLMTGDDRGYGYVEDAVPELTIALLPGYRGLGIGTQLLARLMYEVSLNYSAVSLSVSADNPARRLYERHGFVLSGEDGDSLTMIFRFTR